VSAILRESRRIARHERALAYWAVLLAMGMSLWVGATAVPPEWMRVPALFVHLGGVIVGLGAAVLLETKGLLWAVGRNTVEDVRRIEHTVSPLAWMGIFALLASGAFLHPDLTNPLTVVKMFAVLIAALNGVAMTRLTDELERLPANIRFGALPLRMRTWMIWSATVSQLSWWTAVIIGMLNTAMR